MFIVTEYAALMSIFKLTKDVNYYYRETIKV